jgi:hypothetical protein
VSVGEMNEQPPSQSVSPARLEFLLVAFQDTEATVRATDTKASIALVVHGFIFAGLLGVLSRVTSLAGATSCFRALIFSLTAATGIMFLASIGQLLRCVVPAPASTVPATPQPCVAYLEGTANRISGRPHSMPSFDELKGRIQCLDEIGLESELTAELLKVSAIRVRKVALARSGFELLGVEVVFALALLAALAIERL